MLVKMGLTGVVASLLKCRCGIVADIDAKRPDQFLGIRKCRVHQLIEKNGDLNILETMQMEYRMRAEWSDEQIDQRAAVAESNRKVCESRMGNRMRKRRAETSKRCKYIHRLSEYEDCSGI